MRGRGGKSRGAVREEGNKQRGRNTEITEDEGEETESQRETDSGRKRKEKYRVEEGFKKIGKKSSIHQNKCKGCGEQNNTTVLLMAFLF